MNILQIQSTHRNAEKIRGAKAVVNKGFTHSLIPDSMFLQSAKRHCSTTHTSLVLESATSDGSPPEVQTSDHDEPENEGIQEAVRKRKTYLSSELPLLVWIPFQDEYLFATLRLEGRGNWSKECTRCSHELKEWFRCDTCFGCGCLCRACVVQTHKHHPLHILKVWENGYWNEIDLRKLGIRVNLGHPPGTLCGMPSREAKEFVVIHSDKIHTVHVIFCGCRPSYPDRQQLLDAGWWPATPSTPATAASFEVLRLFDKMNGRGRISTYHFCQALEDMSNPRGLHKTASIYESLKLMAREYRYVKMRKRAGCGHDGYIEIEIEMGTGNGDDVKKKVRKTREDQPGALALECRACPHPQTKRTLPSALRWLNTLFLSKDANFRSKGRDRSSDERDPSLVKGGAYVVEHQQYLRTISKIRPTEEDSHCSGFNAMMKANERRSKGLRATGIGMVMCSRHELVRPQSIGDLQKGEQYRNMDYLFLRSVVGATYSRLAVCYDIACQWSINLWKRMALFPEDMRLTIDKSRVGFFIPKFHRAAHVSKCPTKHTLNYAKGVARVDGECTERGWSALNQLSPALKELGPGGRHDLIDSFVDRFNWRKVYSLGPFMKKKLASACTNFVLHNTAHRAFTEMLRQNNPETVVELERTVKAWEKDNRSPDPFVYKSTGESMTAVRARLAIEEEKSRTDDTQYQDTLDSPSTFIWEIMNLEKLSASLRADATKKHLSPTESLSITQKRRELQLRRAKLQDARGLHMPGLSTWLSIPREASGKKIECQSLWPPSAIPKTQWSTTCQPNIISTEAEMRLVQAAELLEDLRRHLRGRMVYRRYKIKNLVGQKAHTRSAEVAETVERKISITKELYRDCYKALLTLKGSGDWQKTFRLLHDGDIVGINERLLDKEELALTRQMAGIRSDSTDDQPLNPPTIPLRHVQLGEGHRQTSWIWWSITPDELNQDLSGALSEGVRVEWAKSHARCERWREELVLLEEEMRRVLVYCEWKAGVWLTRAQSVSCDDSALKDGLVAYALEHGGFELEFRKSLDSAWKDLRDQARRTLIQQTKLRKLDSTHGYQEDDEVDVAEFEDIMTGLGSDDDNDADEEADDECKE